MDDGFAAVAEPGFVGARAWLLRVLERPGYAFTDAQVLENLRAVYALAATVEAVKLAFVHELASRPQTVIGGPMGRGAKRFLTEALHVSSGQANRGLAAAKATRAGAAELPGMGAALAEGEVSREHMDGAVTAARKFPKPVKEKILPDRRVDAAGRPVACRGIEALDDLLSDEARRAQPSAMDLLARKLLHELDPDRLDRFDPDAFERITCTISTDFAGLTTFRLVSDPVNAMLITAAIKRRNAPRPPGTSVGENGETVVVPDTRLPGQRTAEAMIELLLAGAGLQPATPSTDPAPTPVPTPAPIRTIRSTRTT